MNYTIKQDACPTKPIIERERASMRHTIKKALAAVTAVATAAVVAPLMTAAPAFASPPAPQTGAVLTPTSGIGSTAFTLTLPNQAACAGDSAGGGWRWQTYMVPATVDPAGLQFNANGPVPAGVGATFRQPLFDVFGTPLVDQLTALADTAGGPGLILNVPQTNFEVFAPGDVLPGAYNVGIACTLGAPSATQLDRYWNLKMTVSSNPVGGAAQVSWAQGAVPEAPTLSPLASADGSLTATFTQPAGSDPAVSGFTATATPTGGGSPVTAIGATSPIVIGGLTNGTEYAVTVHATNSVGNSAESNSVNGTPSITRLPVQNLVATPGTGTVDLLWTAPNDAATYPPTGYTVTNLPADGTVAVTVTATGGTAAASGLTAGTVYTFTVTPTYSSGPLGIAANVVATPLSAQVLVQDVTVTRPTGALVLTQVCGVNGVIPADTSGTAGFPDGSLPEIPAVTTGTGPTTTAGGTEDPRYGEGEYPYPDNADGMPNATYPTHCGVDLQDAQFVKSGPGAGQYFAASGVLDQVTIVDTRDEDTGWEVSGSMSRFINQVDGTKSFAGSQLGWTPKVSSTSPAFTDSDGIVYDQVATKGDKLNPGLIEASGLGGGATLAHSGTGAVKAAPGLGIAQLDARLKLLIPVTKRSGAYTGTLTITVT